MTTQTHNMNRLCAVCKDKCKQVDWVYILRCPDFVHKKTGKSSRAGLSPKGSESTLGIRKTITKRRVYRATI